VVERRIGVSENTGMMADTYFLRYSFDRRGRQPYEPEFRTGDLTQPGVLCVRIGTVNHDEGNARSAMSIVEDSSQDGLQFAIAHHDTEGLIRPHT
jgi:hypothetical protein